MSEMHTNLELGAYGALPLEDARGRVVTCVSGVAWLTMEGDERDIVLEPGQSFTVDRDGLTLVASQQLSNIRVSRPRQVHTWWQRVVDFLDRNFGPAALRPARKWVY